jgi:hypothetical protein
MDRFDALLLACKLRSREINATLQFEFVELWPELRGALIEWLVYSN